MDKLYVIAVFFNPAGFTSLLRNYYIFKEYLTRHSNIELLTIELSFNGKFQIEGENVHRLTSNSVMWQKERLINYGISQLPADAKYFAWLDCDIIFLHQDWVNMVLDELQRSDIIQPFKRVYFGTNGETEFTPFFKFQQSVFWQYRIHKNWLERRQNKNLGFAAPGFAYCAKVSLFKDLGLYDKCITGSGDSALVDVLLDSDSIHAHSSYFTSAMKEDLTKYREKLLDRNPKVGYIPIDLMHLYHGTIANRNYVVRHEILQDNNFNPNTDIKLENNVFEWNTPKHDLHERLNRYFFDRKEDI